MAIIATIIFVATILATIAFVLEQREPSSRILKLEREVEELRKANKKYERVLSALCNFVHRPDGLARKVEVHRNDGPQHGEAMTLTYRDVLRLGPEVACLDVHEEVIVEKPTFSGITATKYVRLE